MKTQVSIVTPCYNAGRYIAQTIESVLVQTFTDWEMIIVDDGSTDNSAKIVNEFSQKDSRIKLIRQKNGGSACARNNGISNACGRFIALLDADDLWDENFLSEQIAFMQKKNALCVFSSYRKIDGDSKPFSRPVFCRKSVTYAQMTITNYIGCLTGLYDTSIFGKVYLREEMKSLRDDYAYWLDILKKCGKAYGNQKILASYRVMDSSTTGKKKKLVKVQYKFYREFLGFGIIHSAFNTLRWAMRGMFNFM